MIGTGIFGTLKHYYSITQHLLNRNQWVSPGLTTKTDAKHSSKDLKSPVKLHVSVALQNYGMKNTSRVSQASLFVEAELNFWKQKDHLDDFLLFIQMLPLFNKHSQNIWLSDKYLPLLKGSCKLES